MKTKTKNTAQKRKHGKVQASPPSGKQIEDRDLNDDDQKRITNAEADDERYQKMPVDDVEKEEEREKKRRVEDARGEEEN